MLNGNGGYDDDDDDDDDNSVKHRILISFIIKSNTSKGSVARHDIYLILFCLFAFIAHGQNLNPIGTRSVQFRVSVQY